MKLETIVHDIPPLYDAESRVLLLGSLPSPAVLGEKTPETIEEKREMCHRHHIALWDTVAKCDIAGASDTSIRNAEPNDIGRLLRESKIERIFATGGKSGELYRKLIQPKTHVPITVLPSTSPANAAWTFERLVEAYRVIL